MGATKKVTKKPIKKAKFSINDIWAEGSLTKAFALAAKLLEDGTIDEHGIEAAYTDYTEVHGWTIKIIGLTGGHNSTVYHRVDK